MRIGVKMENPPIRSQPYGLFLECRVSRVLLLAQDHCRWFVLQPDNDGWTRQYDTGCYSRDRCCHVS